jgi:drug/metabolite transporter (DMT)-like permease
MVRRVYARAAVVRRRFDTRLSEDGAVAAQAHAIADADGPARESGSAAAGAALCLLSAAGFGAMAIFGKLAYDAGVSTLTLLLARFALATLVFGSLIAARARPQARVLRGRPLAVGLALGAVGYATQSGLFFSALRRLDASLLALLLYTFPAWVTLAAFALGRERPTRRRLTALAASSAGLVVVLTGAAGGGFDGLGAALAVGAAFAYTAYILVADRAGVAVSPLLLAGLVCAGATATFALVGLATGGIDLGFAREGWLWLALIALVSTALPIVAFFAGLARVGPSSASILSTFEPVVTVTLAYLAFSERLSAAQLAGGALVLAAAVLLTAPSRAREVSPD